MRHDTIMEKIEDTKANIAQRKDEIKRSEAGENVWAGVDSMRMESKKEKVAELEAELAELEAEFNVKTGDTNIEQIISEDKPPMKKKVMELKHLTAATGAEAPTNITTILDNKRVSSDVYSNNHHMMAMANVDHSDAAVKSINDIRFNNIR